MENVQSFVKPSVDTKDLYYLVTENGMQKKFANMDHPLVCQRKGVVRIESIRRGKNKQPNISYCRTYDAANRITYGIPTGTDPQGKIILKRFYLPEFRVFNLINIDEAEEWAILRHHEVIKTGQYVIYDEEKIAQKEINEISLIKQAVGIAEDMKLKDWVPCARFFGKQPEGMSSIKLQSEIMNIAKDSPSELINYWEQENREVIDIFNSAESVGIIHHDFVKGWMYKKTLPLGSTKEAAIRFVQKDQAFCRSLLDETKQLDVTTQAIVNGEAGEKKSSTFDLKENQDNKELVDLRIKAQLLNIPGYSNMSEEQLKARVEQAEDIAMNDNE